MLGKDYVGAVLNDWRTAPLSWHEKNLWALVEKAATASHTVQGDDVEAARAAGWSDEALHDALTVVSLFKFYNTWNDATGVHGMPAVGYDVMAKRMAAHGYLPLDA